MSDDGDSGIRGVSGGIGDGFLNPNQPFIIIISGIGDTNTMDACSVIRLETAQNHRRAFADGKGIFGSAWRIG